ncbi:unnamed protein product [Peronospora belbahrii]|uniref:Uncharacterized protein n=1 Tax=Peronospora belbahrii TaxID=622444 RepID=A0AAU9L100_9STRA|nr:unnamed protein product [Peronospora belbahrii]CAH0478833.1 unnamed protein product [Peronospora belbahrii]CAH0515543.1 unnamed protein product [Peronospora belbahrii]
MRMRIVNSIYTFLATTFASATASIPTYIYRFNAAHAAGVNGFIRVQYTGEDSSIALITSALDFSAVNQTKLAAFDGNCTDTVTSYKWHIHTKWNSTLSSDSFKQCSKAATGNHYDPLKACGPASEYITEPDCKAKSLTYSCNSTIYKTDPFMCEKGDMSGKFGVFDVRVNSTLYLNLIDKHYPVPYENTDTWSIVIHAVCGKETPRIACAVGYEYNERETEQYGKKDKHEHAQCR